jgi:hypothetical protein
VIEKEYAFPLLYAPWMADLLGGPIPDETKATCHDCVMCSNQTASDLYTFDPRTKCCTYEPRIPNFLTGRILIDNSELQAEGRASILARIGRRAGVSPLGLDQSNRYSTLYSNATKAFGRAPGLLCPHYIDREGGLCGIWKYRPSVCATWFCKHIRGAVGQNFWRRMTDLLITIETELSVWCAAELHAGSPDLLPLPKRENHEIDASEFDGPSNVKRYAETWGQWAGKESEYYANCARLVEPLNWSQIVEICGPYVRMRSRFTQEAYRELVSDFLPERLRVGNFTIDGIVEGKLRVSSYRPFDPLLMSDRLARALPYFAGQKWEEAVEAIRVELGLQLNREMLHRLVDFGILVACDNSATVTDYT